MLTVHFLDSDEYTFAPEDRRNIDDIAAAAEQQLRVMLPLVESSASTCSSSRPTRCSPPVITPQPSRRTF